jgi:ABC-2 type transport system ATP-binding protein
MTDMIEARGLAKSYGTTEVLRGVDLTIRAGEIFALLGPNGAGKTTTVRILGTLSPASAGTARVAGADVDTERHLVRRRIALTGQYAALDDGQTGRENLTMMGRLLGLGRRPALARSAELLERFDLVDAADRRVGKYSGGMRRRLDVAASLLGRPSVLFLDEPTTGLDPRSRKEVSAIVAELARGGTTVFLTTQYLEEADRLADRIAVIDGGVVVANGTAAELKASVGEQRLELTATSGDAYETLHVRLGERLLGAEPATRTLDVAVSGDAAPIRALLDDLDPDAQLINRFAVRSASLDDAFLALTGRPAYTATTEQETVDD